MQMINFLKKLFIQKFEIGVGTGLAISGGASLIGGLANIFSNNAINKANMQAQERANQLNYQAQKEFLKNSVQWRKQDALNAGINPIYAMGMQSTGFSPSFQAYQQTPNDYSFIGKSAQAMLEYYHAEKQQQLAEKQADANISRDTAQADYYKALTKKTNKEIESLSTSSTSTAKTAKEIQKKAGVKINPTEKNPYSSERVTPTIESIKIEPPMNSFLGEKAQDSIFANESFKAETSDNRMIWGQEKANELGRPIIIHGSYYDGIDIRKIFQGDMRYFNRYIPVPEGMTPREVINSKKFKDLVGGGYVVIHPKK